MRALGEGQDDCLADSGMNSPCGRSDASSFLTWESPFCSLHLNVLILNEQPILCTL